MSEVDLDFSAKAILLRMRESLKSDANKLEGGFCMDNLQAVAEEMARMDAMEVSPIADRVLLDTAEGEYLDRRALDYNETRLDGESDDAFRARLLEKIRRPITSGNRNQYIYWAKQVSGVGAAKCLGAEVCGAGQVRVIVLSDTLSEPDGGVLETVREHIGTERIIGAQVTVAAATPKAAALAVTVKLANGYDLETVRDSIRTKVQEYIESVNRADFAAEPAYGDESRESRLSYFQIGNLIFDVDGVSDVVSYTLNGASVSLLSGYEEYFTLEEVAVSGDQ